MTRTARRKRRIRKRKRYKRLSWRSLSQKQTVERERENRFETYTYPYKVLFLLMASCCPSNVGFDSLFPEPSQSRSSWTGRLSAKQQQPQIDCWEDQKCVCVCVRLWACMCKTALCVCSRRHKCAFERKQCHRETVCKCMFVYERYKSVCFEFGCVNARALLLCYSRTVADRIPNCDGLIEYVCESVTFPVCHFLWTDIIFQ